MFTIMSSKRQWTSLFIAIVMALLAFATFKPVQSVQASCGQRSTYTQWYWAGYPKPTLFVWKGGAGKPNPTNVIVQYNNRTAANPNWISVPNAEYGIQTGSPQVDLKNGYVGYFIAKRWYSLNWGWDDDWRWFVSGCIQ